MHWSGGVCECWCPHCLRLGETDRPFAKYPLSTPSKKLKPDCGGSISSELDDVRGKMR